MPAEITTGEFCASYYGSYRVAGSKPGTSYVVSFDGLGAHCTCPAFKYSGDSNSCKHISFVFKNACMWNCQWHDGNENITIKPDSIDEHSVIKGQTCPNCGGPVVAVRIAV